jgi:hypothetical protein
MSNDSQTQVKIRADFGSESIGKSEYVLGNDQNSKSLKVSVFVMGALTISIFTGMYFTSKNPKVGISVGLASPTMSLNQPEVSSKLLTVKDLTNLIQKPKSDSSLLGKIKVVSLRTTSEIPTGSVMSALLVSGATDGIVKARLTAPLNIDGETVFPEQSTLFGKGASGEERLFIEFSKVIFPSGEAYPIRAQAFEQTDKIQGLKGAVVGTRTKKMATAIAFGFLAGTADGMQESNGSMFMNKEPTLREAALGGASKAALDQSQLYLDEMKKLPNVIEVKSGTEFIAIIDEPIPKESKRDEK